MTTTREYEGLCGHRVRRRGTYCRACRADRHRAQARAADERRRQRQKAAREAARQAGVPPPYRPVPGDWPDHVIDLMIARFMRERRYHEALARLGQSA